MKTHFTFHNIHSDILHVKKPHLNFHNIHTDNFDAQNQLRLPWKPI